MGGFDREIWRQVRLFCYHLRTPPTHSVASRHLSLFAKSKKGEEKEHVLSPPFFAFRKKGEENFGVRMIHIDG